MSEGRAAEIIGQLKMERDQTIEILQLFLDKKYFENFNQTIIECHHCGIGIYETLLPYPDNWKLLSHDEDCLCVKAVAFLRQLGQWPAWQQA